MIADKKLWDCLSFSDRTPAKRVVTDLEPTPQLHNDLDTLIEKAHGLWKQREREAAIALLEEAAAIDANYVQNWLDSAKERYRTLLQRASSIDIYNRKLDAAPSRVKAWSRLDSSRVSSKDRWQQALTSYDRLLEVQPNNHLAWYYRGDALLELQRVSEALASFKRAIESERRAKGGWITRVRKLIRTQRIQEAIALCGYASISLKAKTFTSEHLSGPIRQEFHDSWRQLGDYCYQLEVCQEAVVAYQRALSFQPEAVETWLARGRACETLREYAEAIACYDRVLSLRPGHSGAKSARQRLYG